MLLYALAHSSYAAKVRLVIAHKGIERLVEVREPPGGLRSDEFRRLAPLGQIPVLRDGDLLIGESEAIAEYLEERFPDPPLLPSDPAKRARARFLVRVHDLHLEPPVRTLYWQVPVKSRDAAVVQAGFERVSAMLRRLAALAQPAPYLLGANLTLADTAFVSTLLYLDLVSGALGRDPGWPPALRDWRSAVAAHPSVASVLDWHRPAAEQWLARKLAE